ncbi:hypothetical protein KIW84_053360 [Lathyrus oleraceus]|uniref:Uncharacterized protein n=1 Tax=Pisum sativum TaxID=3888 RepID=A0A9D5AG61_PEA|nr:hypothetical protein KIW84_053360 [Pisum sativum]
MQTDLRDILHLRKNLLKAVLNHLDWKGYSTLSERMGLYMPSAIFALCVGCVAFNECFKETSLIYSSFDVTESLDSSHKFEDPKHQCLHEFLDCSVEALTEIHKVSNVEVSELQIFPGIRVPQEISDQLLLETETSILEMLAEEENNGTHLPDIFLKCSLLSNLLYGYFFTRAIKGIEESNAT